VAERTQGPQPAPVSPRQASVASTHDASTGNAESLAAVGGAQATFDLSKGVLANVPAQDIRGVVESKGISGVKSAACVDLSRNKVIDDERGFFDQSFAAAQRTKASQTSYPKYYNLFCSLVPASSWR
jgi:hypothetical protein